MIKKRKEIKAELKEELKGSESFDIMIDKAVIYILNNFKIREVAIEYIGLLKKKRRAKT